MLLTNKNPTFSAKSYTLVPKWTERGSTIYEMFLKKLGFFYRFPKILRKLCTNPRRKIKLGLDGEGCHSKCNVIQLWTVRLIRRLSQPGCILQTFFEPKLRLISIGDTKFALLKAGTIAYILHAIIVM